MSDLTHPDTSPEDYRRDLAAQPERRVLDTTLDRMMILGLWAIAAAMALAAIGRAVWG